MHIHNWRQIFLYVSDQNKVCNWNGANNKCMRRQHSYSTKYGIDKLCDYTPEYNIMYIYYIWFHKSLYKISQFFFFRLWPVKFLHWRNTYVLYHNNQKTLQKKKTSHGFSSNKGTNMSKWMWQCFTYLKMINTTNFPSILK